MTDFSRSQAPHEPQVLSGRNVNDIYRQGRRLLAAYGEPQGSRAGAVVVCPWPVLSAYDRPLERVLFDPSRDANPFFHVVEGIWMLSGSADGRVLDKFVKGFSERYTEKWGGIHGAYGARWRRHWEFDQLRTVMERLRRDPFDRRVVISMWDPAHDLWSLDSWVAHHEGKGEIQEEYFEPKDLPCNTHIYPRIRQDSGVNVLDLTVCCRSNDQIWGAHGANAVHFSMLQEYLAAGLGIEVGKLYQLSNNFHLYPDIADKRPLHEQPTDYYDPTIASIRQLEAVTPSVMVTDFQSFDQDIRIFMEAPGDPRKDALFANPWFAETLQPVVRTMAFHRQASRQDALDMASCIAATDWRLACLQWLKRRYDK